MDREATVITALAKMTPSAFAVRSRANTSASSARRRQRVEDQGVVGAQGGQTDAYEHGADNGRRDGHIERRESGPQRHDGQLRQDGVPLAMRLRTLIQIPPATAVRHKGTVNMMASAGS